MKIKNGICAILLSSSMPLFCFAASIFTITPVSNTFSVTRGTSAVVEFSVKNTSGQSLTITSESVSTDNLGRLSAAVSSTSTCENSVLAANGTCVLDIDVTGNDTGESGISPVVCAFNGQLCSKTRVPIETIVAPINTYNCALNSDTKNCRVFVSANVYAGDLSTANAANIPDISTCENDFTSLAKGNCICEKEAVAAGLSHPGHWRAWLSMRTVDAKDNIGYDAAVAYYRTDEVTLIAAAGQLLTNPFLAKSISFAANDVWTGTNSSGVIKANDKECSDWTDGTLDSNGRIGESDATNRSWTDADDAKCNIENRIYCFESPQ